MNPEAPGAASLLHEEIASASAAARVGDSWYILDGRSSLVHRIGPDAGLISSFGGYGHGPGEIASSGGIAPYLGKVAVLDGASLEIYETDGTHADQLFIEVAGCELFFAESLVGLSTGLAVLYRCEGDENTERVAVQTDTGQWRQVVRPDQAETAGFTFNLARATPVLSAYGDGFAFGFSEDDCLTSYSTEGTVTGEICHDQLYRAAMPREVRDRFEALVNSVDPRVLEQSGAEVEIPETFPPFDWATAMPDGRLAYRVMDSRPDDPLEISYSLATLSETGEQVRLPVPPADYIFTDGTTALAGWSELEGTRIELFDLAGS